jgi:glycosyltransferase involved in cell wall biosynthesis
MANKSDCKITMLLTAFDRQEDLRRFAASVSGQTYSGMIEIVYVAQGAAQLNLESIPGRLTVKTIVAGGRLPLSVARNLAVTRASGDILAFPDDDCWYPDELLEKIAGYFAAHPGVDCVCTSVYDPLRKVPFGRRPLGVIRRITYGSLFRLPISVGIFVRRKAFFAVGGAFNEELGAGARIGSGEETELIGRLLEKSYRVEYLGTLQVFHPVEPRGTAVVTGKYYGYAYGFGVLHGRYLKAGHPQVLWHLSEVVLRSCVGALLPGRGRVFRERLSGIRDGLRHGWSGKD